MSTMRSGYVSRALDRVTSHISPLKVSLTVPVVALLLLSTSLPLVTSAASAPGSVPSSTQASTAGSPPYAATGYFYVTQKASGGWTLVTPQGEPYYTSGIDTVSPRRLRNRPGHGRLPLLQHCGERLPEHRRLGNPHRRPRFARGASTTLGPFSDDADLGSQMPYEVQLSMASGDDWFAPSFVTHADDVAQTQVAPLTVIRT